MIALSDIVFRLVYVSRVSPEREADMDGVLSEILAYALPRNRKLGVTSLLMAHRGWFIQVLEGPEPAVRDTFKAASGDPRHRLMRVVAEGGGRERMFPRWSLAMRILTPADAAVLRGFDDAPRFDPAALPERTLMRLAAVVAKAHQERFDAQQKITIRRRPKPASQAQCRH